ncbi:MAG: winged helix-turn-helix transcriptional regulator [Bacilli bacterium]|nr:winged helix-turn-helix transcriptional regulator [Bacilli bacterium]
MKFLFNQEVSKLYDFLMFPKLLNKEIYDDIAQIDDYIDKEFEALLARYSDILSPYAKEINLFYTKNIFYANFIEQILTKDKLLTYTDPHEFLDFLLTLSSNQVKQIFVKSLLKQEKDNPNINELINEVMSSNEKIMNLINDLLIDSSVKWNLYLIIQEPEKYLNIYVNLMKQLYPVFLDYYQHFETKLISYGKFLENYLNEKGSVGLEEITHSLLDKSLILDDYNDLLISCIFPYSLSFIDLTDGRIIVWGLHIEDASKKLKENYDNRLNNRIQVFKNLGDKTRYEVLKLISKGITSTKDIATVLNVSSATISYHLNALLAAKLIKISTNNRKFSYEVDSDVINEVFQELINDLQS